MYRCLIGLCILLVAITSEGQQLKDPTKPLSGKSSFGQTKDQSRPFVLQSVIIRGDNKTAYINNKKLKIGDTLSEYIVVDITRAKVKLKSDSSTIELNLYKQAVMK